MPFYPLPKKYLKKSGAANSPSSDDSSLDEHGNVRNLIDYDYEESLSSQDEEYLPERKAKIVAKKQIQKISKSEISTTGSSTSEENNSPRMTLREISKTSKNTKITKTAKNTMIKKSKARYDEDEDESEEEERPVRRSKKSKARYEEEEDESEEERPVRRSKKSKTRYEEEEDESEEEERPVRRSKKSKARYEEEEDESEEERPVRRSKKSKARYEEEEDESEEERPVRRSKKSKARYEEEEDEDEYDEEDEEDEDYEEDNENAGGKISLFQILGGGGDDPRKPKKYNLKKEPANVRRFVELMNHEDEEEDNIDNDITYFKSLSADSQQALMKVLESKAAPVEVQTPLKFKILERVSKHPELSRIAMSKYQALMNIDPSSTEYYKCSHWINGFTNLPLGNYRDLPVCLEDGPEKCHAFMEKVHKCMDEAIFGHDEAKLQIMQFVSSWIANPKAHGNVLSIYGPPGVGKTSLIKDGVAKALDRPFYFITLGGATDASFLDGHSYTYEGSTWGKIADVLMQSKCMNPIIYFDELDKVSDTPKGEEIMNMLIHITDGSQNDRFQDKYFTGINLDLSRCLFIFSHNNHERVNPILRDRMYNIQVKGFNTKEKIKITEKYILRSALQESGLFEKISIDQNIFHYIIENFTGGEEGVRELKRCIQTVISKINLLRFFNNPKHVPFSIKDFSLPFNVKREHIDLFLKRKEQLDPSLQHMYI